MEPNNFAAWVAQQKVLESSDVVLGDDLIAIGKKVKKARNGTQYEEFAITVQDLLALVSGGAVTSVFGRNGVVTAQAGDYNTSLVPELTNLYFTDARAIAAPLTGYLPGAGVVSATDTILQAIQKLDGNIAALPSGSGTLNYLSKWTPDGTTLGDSQVFDNGTGVAIGTNSPIANTLLTLKGIDSTFSNYALKVDNFDSSPLLYVRNDGSITMNNNGYIFQNTGSVYFGSSSNSTAGQLVLRYSDDTQVGNLQAFSAGSLLFDSPNLFFRNMGGTTQMFKEGSTGNFAIGTAFTSPTAKLSIRSDNSLNTSYGLNIVTNVGLNALKVSNAGRLGIGHNHSGDPLYDLDIKSIGGVNLINAENDNNITDATIRVKTTQAGNEMSAQYIAENANGDSLRLISFGTAYSLVPSFAGHQAIRYTNNLLFNNGSTNRVVITSTGNVGIGTQSPTSKLYIAAPDAISSALQIRSSDNTYDIVNVNGNGYSTFRSITIDSPLYPILNFTNATNTWTAQNAAGSFYISQGGNDNLILDTTGSARVRANLFVGNFTDANSRLYVRGLDSASYNYALKVQNSSITDLLTIRNDGFSQIHGLNIGRGGGGLFNNVAFGYLALNNPSNTGQENVAIGYTALLSNTTGNGNVAVGYNALNSNSVGSYNIALGENALPSNQSGGNNISLGLQSCFLNQSGHANIALGYRSLYSNTSGGANVAIGGDATLYATTGNSNVAVGYYAGQASNGSYNVFIGTYAGWKQGAISNKLFIDCNNGTRVDAAAELADTLIIGTFGASAASQELWFNAQKISARYLPTYADNAAATGGGLIAGDIYKTATGELRITV